RRRAFGFQRVEGLALKGMGEPVAAYQVRRARERPEKVRGIEGLRARMIGREREFAAVQEACEQWLSGRGQMVSIIGEAGIGKSRLLFPMRQGGWGRGGGAAGGVLGAGPPGGGAET